MFRRRGVAARPAADPDIEDIHQGAIVAVMPLPAAPVTTAGVHGIVTGWAPMPGTPHPNQQIGMFAGGMLNQFPAYLPGVQRHSGVEWLNSGYYTPARYGAPNGNGVQPTQQLAYLPGAQRAGSTYGGPIGPITVAAVRERVVVAQIRASGANALGWARSLNPNYVPNTNAGLGSDAT